MSTTTRRGTTVAAKNDWQPDAACATVDPDLFFPVGESRLSRAQEDEAKLVCRRCPVIEQCLEWALANEQDVGVWGGLTERERRALHRRRPAGYWKRRRNIAEDIVSRRQNEFVTLLDQGLTEAEIATAMRTNVQTVNTVKRALEAAKVVKAA